MVVVVLYNLLLAVRPNLNSHSNNSQPVNLRLQLESQACRNMLADLALRMLLQLLLPITLKLVYQLPTKDQLLRSAKDLRLSVAV